MKGKYIYFAVGIAAFIFGIAISIEQYLLPVEQPFEEVMTSEEILTLVENGIPMCLIKDYPKYNRKQAIKPDIDTVIHSGEDHWKIYFKEMESLQGKWYGNKPIFRKNEQNPSDSFSCISNRFFNTSTNSMGWISISQNAASKPFEPYLKMTLKVDSSENCLHTTIRGTAALNVTYPVRYRYGYIERKKKLEKDVHFFLVSGAEMQLLEQSFPPDRLEAKDRTEAIVFPGVIGLLIGIMVIGLYYVDLAEKKKKRSNF
jgi:hypothetical protein